MSLVGLPNSGKSSVFNILTSAFGDDDSPVDVSLFTTTDIYVGSVSPRDERLDWLADR